MSFFVAFFIYSLPFVYSNFRQKKIFCSRKWWVVAIHKIYKRKRWKYFPLDFKVQSQDTNLTNFKNLLDRFDKGFLVKKSLESFRRYLGETNTYSVFVTMRLWAVNKTTECFLFFLSLLSTLVLKLPLKQSLCYHDN